MSYPRLAQRLYNAPLLISPEKLDIIEQVFRAYAEGRQDELQPFEPKARPALAAGTAVRAQGGYLRTNDGIAIIPVLGTLVQRGSGIDAMSGLTSYDEIGAQLDAALADPMVRGILLEVDSPGGEASGIFDLGARIRAAGAQKPVIAHANEMAYSGGYVIASAAQELYTPKTGMLGSIGVRMLHVDQSQADAKKGLVYTSIYAGAHKNDFDPHAPLTDAALASAQDHINRIYGDFVDHVATMRGMDPQAVRDTEAALLHADQAVERGMANGIATYAETMQKLRDRMSNPGTMFHGKRAAVPSARDLNEGVDMSDKGTPAPVASAPAVSADELAKLQSELVAERNKSAAASIAARDRVKAITTCDAAKERPQLAQHLAYDTEMSAEAAAALLAKAAVETAKPPANAFAEAMGRQGNPRVAPDAAASRTDATGDTTSQVARPVAANIFAFRQKCVADARRG